jgi:excinuclease ABC subunit A
MGRDFIQVRGARQHNLKNVSVDIPRDRLVVVTGPSGSGKSSLAFDTLFAEGQRKYVESLSVFARQFLDQLPKPDVDSVDGLSPSIAIEQRTSGGHPRSTVATTTEIHDFLRLLYAHAGAPHDPDTGARMAAESPGTIADRLLALPEKTRLMLLAPIVDGPRQNVREAMDKLAGEGFARVRVDAQIVDLGGRPAGKAEPVLAERLDAVVDRLIIAPGLRPRLADSIESALKTGGGRLRAMVQGPDDPKAPWREEVFTTKLYSAAGGRSFDPPSPQLFSFNSPQGACPVCHGLGQKMVFDPALIVPDPEKTLEDGAVHPYRRIGGKRMAGYYRKLIEGVAKRYGAPLDAPWKKLPAVFRERLLFGTGEDEIEFHFARAGSAHKARRTFEGVLKNLERLYGETESEFTRGRLKAYMTPAGCEGCAGRRLKPEALAVTLASTAAPGAATRIGSAVVPGLSIADFCELTVGRAAEFLQGLTLTPASAILVGDVVARIRARLGFLREVGLDYLTLGRESGTLSGGEAQRIRLATQLGAGLMGVLYILDEPSIGLHPRDNARLLDTLRRLRDLGNTVIVVEHDEDTILAADHVIDLGPGAGALGGEIIAEGPPRAIIAHPRSPTGAYLRGDTRPGLPRRAAPSAERGWLEVRGAREHNLRGVSAKFPLGLLTCVTGVSGSGKSTLVDDILRRALQRHWHGAKETPGAHDEVVGLDRLDKCIVVDQSPIGRTPRSNPATFTGMFNHIRELYASLPASRVRGFDASRFSFNLRGGRCEKCEGDGVRKVEMHFLPPVYVTCDACNGARYNRETLAIAHKGRNIAAALDLTVDEAGQFFRAHPKLAEPCRVLGEVGLGYLRLGQSATTLSGGEAQRLKLAAELARRQTGRTLYILDEPTTGLHFNDVGKLLEVLFQLRDAGNTLVVVEHNLDVIRMADWVIDLGPEGGEGGGRIVAEGPPEAVAAAEESRTGRFLSRALHAGGAAFRSS